MSSCVGASSVMLGPGPQSLQQSHGLLLEPGASPSQNTCIMVSAELEDAIGGRHLQDQVPIMGNNHKLV
jgi:hypothetical protein